MFDHLLERIGTSTATAGEEYDAVVDAVEGLKSFEARADYFKSLTHQSFKVAVDAAAHPTFYPSWDRVRTARNNFVHGNPFAIKAPIAVLGMQLVRDAISVFAKLQNTYAIRVLAGDEEG
jgi:hypothetical protein